MHKLSREEIPGARRNTLRLCTLTLLTLKAQCLHTLIEDFKGRGAPGDTTAVAPSTFAFMETGDEEEEPKWMASDDIRQDQQLRLGLDFDSVGIPGAVRDKLEEASESGDSAVTDMEFDAPRKYEDMVN